jgi:RNA polymerase-binding transcription factor DksA
LPTKKESAKSASTPAAKAKAAAPKPSAKPSAGKPAPAKPAVKPAAKPAVKAVGKPAGKVSASAPVAKNNGGAKSVEAANGKISAKTAAPVAKTNGKTPAPVGKPNGKAAVTTPAAKASTPAAKTSTPAAKTSTPAAKTVTPAAKASTPAAKTVTPAAKTVTPAAKTSTPAAKSAAPASGKSASTKAKPEASDTPNVPKKGPIDLAQHKSVAAAAAAVANARGGASNDFIIINGRRVRAISTKGITVAKKSKESASEAAPAPTEQQIASIKTKLGKKELEEYRNLLLAKRRQLVGMLSGMEDEALRSSGGNLSNMPVHMADMGSDVYEQDFTLGMAETERAIVGEIDAALQRIEDKTFGVCQMTGKPIAKARLDAKPWAKFTIEAERIAESGGLR